MAIKEPMIVGGAALVVKNLGETMDSYLKDTGTFSRIEIDHLELRRWADEMRKLAPFVHGLEEERWDRMSGGSDGV